MRRRIILLICLGLMIISLYTICVEASIQDELTKLVKTAIENIALEAKDMVPDLSLLCSPVKGLVNIKLNLTPLSLKKQAASIKFTGFTSIQAKASFELLAHYDLLVNGKSFRSNDIKMIGEGSVNISFAGLKVKIEDIPSLVLKLADQPNMCPDIGRIIREPVIVKPGEVYQITTNINATNAATRGHIAYFIFANNKVALSPDPTLQVKLGAPAMNYKTALTVQNIAKPDNYFGNVMAIEIVSKTGNPLDFNSYEVLFSTGITMITIK